MPAALTEKEFSQHVNTKFQLKLDDQQLELELVEVKGYFSGPNEQTGMERFSVFFDGPGNARLPQSLYALEHEPYLTLYFNIAPQGVVPPRT